MQAQTALVRADRAVELHAETTVDLHLALIVNPRHTEDDDALRFDEALEQGGFLILRVGLDHDAQRLKHLGDGLDELGLLRILFLDVRDDVVYIGHAVFSLVSCHETDVERLYAHRGVCALLAERHCTAQPKSQYCGIVKTSERHRRPMQRKRDLLERNTPPFGGMGPRWETERASPFWSP